MIEKIKQLCRKYREQLLYLIFGGLTTVMDFGITFTLYFFWGEHIKATPLLLHGVDCLAWVCAVAFAYVTNRIWVFQSRSKSLLPILREILAFAGGRVSTLLLQEGIMLLFVTCLRQNKFLFRIIAAVLVIIINYFISKWLVFKRK